MRDAILQTASLRGSSTENKNATVLTKGVQRRFLPVTLLHPVTLLLFFPISLLLPVTHLLSVPVPIALLLPVLLPLPVTYIISFVRG
jgi:hypothetical protein